MGIQYLVVLILVVLFIFNKLLHTKYQQKNLPPSPPSLPIIGHLHLLKQPIHITIAKLLRIYGPILFIRFGARPVLVLSSPAAIKECFTKNDIIFANRPRLLAGKHLFYNYTVFAMAPYGDLWRNLRRLTTTEIFSTTSLDVSSKVRNEEVSAVVREMYKGYSGEFMKVDLKLIFAKLTYNNLTRILGMKPFFVDDEIVNPEKGRDTMNELESLFVVNGIVAIGDLFPSLKWIDHWRVEKIMLKLFKKRDKFMQNMIDDVRSRRSSSSFRTSSTMEDKKDRKESKTPVDVLLSQQESEPAYYTDDILKGIILMMFDLGTETTSSTMQWAMSLLLNHPEVLDKARREIDLIVGYDRLLSESDLNKLPYLHNIINETLRMYSLGPYLPPHESSDDCTIGGYNIPKGTMLLVNQLGLHHDPTVWPEPSMFKPERFEKRMGESENENEGIKWIPFGIGRRACPGEGLARRFLGLTLGLLIQCFDWENTEGQTVDMTVKFEMNRGTLLKAKPLAAMYKPRKLLSNVLSQL
ncbi:Cytochrome p450 [Thalictrum thalictroides]|uniref:Cytochrome p450 n=1 Tax=Thalictrum thalictroides TaxID=46969 RepID=A0A7J6X8Y4_THATH|nr:Cytochrome p450 [Thalictrum thalictroides]